MMPASLALSSMKINVKMDMEQHMLFCASFSEWNVRSHTPRREHEPSSRMEEIAAIGDFREGQGYSALKTIYKGANEYR
jgi:hypothetical protein